MGIEGVVVYNKVGMGGLTSPCSSLPDVVLFQAVGLSFSSFSQTLQTLGVCDWMAVFDLVCCWVNSWFVSSSA